MKIEEQVLSRKQMAHLRELGIDTSDASLCWRWSNEDGGWVLGFMNPLLREISNPPYSEGPFPAYTVADLIEKLPKTLPYSRFIDVYLQLRPVQVIDNNDNIIDYALGVSYLAYGEKTYRRDAPNQLDNIPLKDKLFFALCWVAENHKELLEMKK